MSSTTPPLRGSDLSVALVNACLRDGRGGSPTAVLEETELSDAERCAVPRSLGTSHAVFVAPRDDSGGVPLRFFTAAGELPACGHGTVAALAYLAEREGAYEGTLRTASRVFEGRAVRVGGRLEASFDPGGVEVREPLPGGYRAVLEALGAGPGLLASEPCVAALGRPRLLVPVATPSALAGLAPDFGRLRAACDRLGLLGCYVHTVPAAGGGRVVARMFAPSIGVPEDIANANSTACLAGSVAAASGGRVDLTVDMGDSLESPATISATGREGLDGRVGVRVRVGGVAAVARTVRL